MKTTKQRKHTDEDVIVGGESFRIPRKINDNVAIGGEKNQGLKTLERVGFDFSGFGMNLQVPEKPSDAVKELKKPLAAEDPKLKTSDIDMEVPQKAPVKGTSHGDDNKVASALIPEVDKSPRKSPPKAKSG